MWKISEKMEDNSIAINNDITAYKNDPFERNYNLTQDYLEEISMQKNKKAVMNLSFFKPNPLQKLFSTFA